MIWFGFSTSYCQVVDIPDANLKYLLVHSSTSLYTAYGCAIFDNYKIDINNNGEIEVNEALAVCQLNLIAANINDLTGIEAFTNLKFLRCDFNNLTTINVSQLLHLKGLNVRQNHLSSIDVSNLTNLKNFDCNNNQVTSLNFANNPMLEKVFCINNQLSSLDFSNNPLFNELDCMNNPNLTTINIKNGTTQLLGPQTYYNQCWTGCPNLSSICADSFEMNTLLNYLDSCGVDVFVIDFTSTCALGNEDFVKKEVAIYPNPANDNVNISSYENIKTVELIDIQGRILQSQTINKSNTNIDISGYSNGVYFVKVTSENAQKSYKLIKN